jgi:hypothetical protein
MGKWRDPKGSLPIPPPPDRDLRIDAATPMMLPVQMLPETGGERTGLELCLTAAS